MLQSSEAVSELTAGRWSGNMSNVFQRFWRHITTVDIFADVRRDEKLMQMHSTAEQFDPAAERLFIPLQVLWLLRLTLAALAYSKRSLVSRVGLAPGAVTSLLQADCFLMHRFCTHQKESACLAQVRLHETLLKQGLCLTTAPTVKYIQHHSAAFEIVLLSSTTGCQCCLAVLSLRRQPVPLSHWRFWRNAEHIWEHCGAAPLPCAHLDAMLVRHFDSCWRNCWRRQTHACHRYQNGHMRVLNALLHVMQHVMVLLAKQCTSSDRSNLIRQHKH